MNIGIRRRKKAGTPPGTLVYTGTNEARPTRITVTEYDQGTIREYAPESAKECSPVLTSSLVNWINVDGLHDAAVLTEMGQVFGIHPLALEDIANTQQRARVQVFEKHLFIVLKMLYPDRGGQDGEADRELDTPEALLEEQISLVVGPNYVITFQEHPGDPFDPIRRRLQTGAGRIRRMGADYLAYALLDTIVDNYFLVLEQLGDHLIALETGVIESGDHSHLQKVYRAKHTLIALRRHIWPLREMVSALVRGDASNGDGPSLIGETTTLYIRDVYDHVIQIIDILESYRDMVSALVDLHISNQSNRMNEVMKVLTIIATIFIPLTFIAGIYGMNFDPAASPFNMPELAWYWGYPASLLAMAAIAGGMLYFFRKKGWL